jgi:hypothetical protein
MRRGPVIEGRFRVVGERVKPRRYDPLWGLTPLGRLVVIGLTVALLAWLNVTLKPYFDAGAARLLASAGIASGRP